jgi:molybdopterin/thiamine biosynthesis adenylyltransferase
MAGVVMDFWRQFDILRPDDLSFPVHMIGCGGIGSPTAIAMSKMGCADVTLWDNDTVENHNLPNQIFRMEDVEKDKVVALSEILQAFTNITPKVNNQQVEATTQLQGVVVSGVDSMEARQNIWQAVRYRTKVLLYIDARMGAEVCRIYTINPTTPNHVRDYEASLYPDGEAQELPCTGRAIIYNVFLIASLICNQIKKFARGEPFSQEIIFDLATLTLLKS